MCQSWFHSTCQDLKASDVVFITKLAAKGAKWFCTERAKEIQGQSTTVVPQVTKLNHLEKMIGNLGEKIDEQSLSFLASKFWPVFVTWNEKLRLIFSPTQT